MCTPQPATSCRATTTDSQEGQQRPLCDDRNAAPSPSTREDQSHSRSRRTMRPPTISRSYTRPLRWRASSTSQRPSSRSMSCHETKPCARSTLATEERSLLVGYRSAWAAVAVAAVESTSAAKSLTACFTISPHQIWLRLPRGGPPPCGRLKVVKRRCWAADSVCQQSVSGGRPSQQAHACQPMRSQPLYDGAAICR